MDKSGTKTHKGIQSKNSPIKKWPDEWIWEPVALGSSGQMAASRSAGEILNDDIYECGFCGGSSEKPRGSRCSVCGGKGTVSVNPPAVICAYCKGSGEEKPRSNITCTACRGKGVIHVQEPVERCSHCQGTGKEPTNKLPCVICRGSGVVTVKEEVEKERYFKPDLEWQEPESFSSPKSHPGTKTKLKSQPVSKAKPREKSYRLPSGSEKEVMEIIYELGAADRAAVGRRMLVSSSYADYLCKSLVKAGLLMWASGKYALTQAGEKLLEKKE